MSSWNRWKNIMKASPFEEKRLAKWTPPYIIQPKYDGDRCKGYKIDPGYLLLTSEENPYFSVPHINESLAESGLNIILDGELYNHQIHQEGGHELIHSIVSRTVNIHSRHKKIQYHIFDVEDGSSQMDRISTLNKIEEMKIPNVVVAPFWICNTLDEIKVVYDRLIKMKFEGIIVRNLYAGYEKKRSIWIMKFKPKAKDTYDIVGWNEEISKDGIPKGRIGSLTLSSQSGDIFKVSAGFNDEERALHWINRDELAGKSAIVHYQHLTNKGIPKGTFDLEVIG